MKNIVGLVLVVATGVLVRAQVVIGDNAGAAVPNSKAILSFTSDKMGIILPIINSAGENAAAGNIVKVPGALFVSRTDRQVKVYESATIENPNGLLALTPSLPTSVPMPTENPAAEPTISTGAIIGAKVPNQNGILVLESDTKTLVLPKIGDAQQPPHKYLKNPYIGTIGFSEIENAVFPTTKPAKKFLWVYGGGTALNDAGQWHLWRAGVELPPVGVIDQNYLNNLP